LTAYRTALPVWIVSNEGLSAATYRKTCKQKAYLAAYFLKKRLNGAVNAGEIVWNTRAMAVSESRKWENSLNRCGGRECDLNPKYSFIDLYHAVRLC
jgi:hypothetical protein